MSNVECYKLPVAALSLTFLSQYSGDVVRHNNLFAQKRHVAKNGNMSNGNIRHVEATFDMLLRHVAGVGGA